MSTRQSGVEVRSIDYVPLSERHGELWHLGPLWFMGNAQIATLAVGVVGIEAGGNLFWSLIAILTGVLTGTFFMAFHSAQGPQLGLPHLVQSRPQFGYVGAAVTVWVFALINYVGYNTADAILSGSAMNSLFGIPAELGFVIAAAWRRCSRSTAITGSTGSTAG
jgi:nucleobase:cation symporter-1, NCS1 family